MLDCVRDSSVDLLLLIDNSATPELSVVAEHRHRVKYIFNGKNLGYGTAHNIAMREAIRIGADYHIVLNPDIYWEGDIVAGLAEYMDATPQVGLCMPQVLYPDGAPQLLCKLLPTPLDLVGRRFIPVKKWRKIIDRRYELKNLDSIHPSRIPSLSGCFMFMRCSTLKTIGLFDERYFMYGEDVDLCRRIGEISDTMFIPYLSIYHQYEKGSYHNSKLLRIHILSMTKYFTKWGWIFDSYRRRANHRCRVMLRSGEH